MTNHWVDLQNCKTILVEGSNVAENHPMAFKWIRKAQENGATIIHVDPRFTRTSAAADVYARIRPGTDVAFQNAMINHIIVNKLYDEDYVVTHTNALYLGDEAFDFKDGVFSGYDAERPHVRHQDLGIPARRQGLRADGQEPRRPALRVLAA
jgi:formate dehydrogenase major subunit